MAAAAAAARPLVTVQSLEGDMATDSTLTLPIPDVMRSSIRPDIVTYIHSNISKNNRQANLALKTTELAESESDHNMGSSANAVIGGRASMVHKDVDYDQYFCTYDFLYHQKEKLSNQVRMDAYFNAIFESKSHFNGNIVLDVGVGSGILGTWSAQAGVRKVYVVEATKMPEHTRALIKANNLQHVTEVIEGSMEDVTLLEKVDVIISEWRGYFIPCEFMFDSVICARDRWLKPTGVMYPSHARMGMAPIGIGIGVHKKSDYESAMDANTYWLGASTLLHIETAEPSAYTVPINLPVINQVFSSNRAVIISSNCPVARLRPHAGKYMPGAVVAVRVLLLHLSNFQIYDWPEVSTRSYALMVLILPSDSARQWHVH